MGQEVHILHTHQGENNVGAICTSSTSSDFLVTRVLQSRLFLGPRHGCPMPTVSEPRASAADPSLPPTLSTWLSQ
jgi:hypothetical protein